MYCVGWYDVLLWDSRAEDAMSLVTALSATSAKCRTLSMDGEGSALRKGGRLFLMSGLRRSIKRMPCSCWVCSWLRERKGVHF